MPEKTRKKADRGALDLIEEAVHLLRMIPARLFLPYYAGSFLFVLAFLYFWSDMSRSPFAPLHIHEAAFSLSLVYILMKSGQAVFMGRLMDHLRQRSSARLTFRRLVRMVLLQGALQPVGFIVLPIALLITVPFGWTFAFFQNVSLYGNGDDPSFRSVTRRAWTQAKLFPGQNNVALLSLLGFGFFVFLNIFITLIALPHLLKMFFGIENVLTMAGGSVLNTTFLMICVAVAYLVMDPLVKAMYVLRCFYGESMETGEDLRVELKNIKAGLKAAAVVLALAGLLSVAPPVLADSEAVPAEPVMSEPSVTPGEINSTVEEVLKRKEFQWRLPRDTEVAAEEEEKGLIASFIEGAVTTIHDWLKSAFDVIKDGIKAIEKKISGLPCMKGKSGKQAARGGSGMSVSAEMLIYLILVALLVVLVIVFIRIRRTKELVHEVEEAPVQEASEPDLTREEITAKELPANNWLGLARSLMAKGEKRLALRALYLAGIAHLADRELLSVEAFKSNRDYQRELERRAHALPEVVSAFSLTMRLFEDVWYGTHEVTENLLDTFDQNHKKVMALE